MRKAIVIAAFLLAGSGATFSQMSGSPTYLSSLSNIWSNTGTSGTASRSDLEKQLKAALELISSQRELILSLQQQVVSSQQQVQALQQQLSRAKQ